MKKEILYEILTRHAAPMSAVDLESYSRCVLRDVLAYEASLSPRRRKEGSKKGSLVAYVVLDAEIVKGAAICLASGRTLSRHVDALMESFYVYVVGPRTI